MDNFADGKFSNLTGFGSRDITYRHNLGRHMTRARSATDLVANFALESIVQRLVLGKDDKQNDSYITLPILTNDDCFCNLSELLNLPIDFSRSDANSARVLKWHRSGRE